MLETAIKSSMADVARNKRDSVSQDNIASDLLHDSDKNKKILNNELSSPCFNEKLTESEKLLVKNENINELEKSENKQTLELSQSFQTERYGKVWSRAASL